MLGLTPLVGTLGVGTDPIGGTLDVGTDPIFCIDEHLMVAWLISHQPLLLP